MSKRFVATVGGRKIELETTSADGLKGKVNDQEYELDVFQLNENVIHALWNNRSYNIEIIPDELTNKKLSIKVNGKIHEVKLQDENDLLLESLGIKGAEEDKVNQVKAPMPGMVLDIMVEKGQEVKKNDPLIVLEAMKMENVLKAPNDCTIGSVSAVKGNAVEKNEVLINLQ